MQLMPITEIIFEQPLWLNLKLFSEYVYNVDDEEEEGEEVYRSHNHNSKVSTTSTTLSFLFGIFGRKRNWPTKSFQ
jgi:hypothetical protein